MSSWLFGWLPGIPSINLALPSSIQGRFVSFVLKKLLGNFVKPGQLDIHQIDSQVGSGYVQVNNLQLENAAINSLLSDLPVELRDGSIASVIARMPWPNPLSSNVGFSLRSLHLIFHLLPTSSNVQYVPVPDLSSSVASVAESFVHDELTPREERFLRESIHPDLPTASPFTDEGGNVPGSIDPFLSAEDEEFQPDSDPEGVSIFASLIERLLARFEFDAVDTRITLVHPERASFTVSISEIRYDTEPKGISGESDQRNEETRRISVSGISITARDLYQPIPSPPSSLSTLPAIVDHGVPSQFDSPPTYSPQSISRSSSSSSSIDEETQLQMSQSILSLPPRQPSPASSLASSLYQSAVSEASTGEGCTPVVSRSNRMPPPSIRQVERPSSPSACGSPLPHDSPSGSIQAEEDETFFMITGNQTVIRLTTPFPRPTMQSRPSTSEETDIRQPVKQGVDVHAGDKLQLSLEIGTIACAFRAWQLQRIIDVSNAWTSYRQPKSISNSEPTPTPAPSDTSMASFATNIGLDARLGVRHIVVILLPSSQTSDFAANHLDNQFFAQPLSPPSLAHGYVRTHLEGLSLSLSLDTSDPDESLIGRKKPGMTRHQRGMSPGSSTAMIDSTLSISEVSVLVFHSRSLVSDLPMLVSPILITDRHLPSQYPSNHVHPNPTTTKPDEHRSYTYPSLPTFDVIDWTDETHQRIGHKLSTWRCKLKPSMHHKHQQARRENQDSLKSTESDYPFTIDSIEHSGQVKQIVQPFRPAILVNAQRAISSSTAKSRSDIVDTIEVTTVPLHIFIDLAMLLSPNGVSAFLNEILDSGARKNDNRARFDSDEPTHHSDAEDGSTPPSTPGLLDEKALAKERLRLERLVLQDMESDEDHPQKKGDKRTNRPGRKGATRTLESSLRIKLPMARIEIRTPSALRSVQRSGAIVFDLHDALLSTATQNDQKPSIRFAGTDAPLSSSTVLSAECRRIVIACSPAGIERATAVISVGPYMLPGEAPGHIHGTPTLRSPSRPDSLLAKPSISLNKSQRSTFRTSEILVLTVDLPSAHLSLLKPALDDLQYWADDATQLIEQAFGKASSDAGKVDSRDSSLIGSRYFAVSKRSDSDGASTIGGRHVSSNTEIVVKIFISEVYIRLMVPRGGNQSTIVIRPFDIFGSDVDVLIELNPDGKDETVLTVGLMDLNIADVSTAGVMTYFMSSTSPRSSPSTTKSIGILRLTSLIVPETTAKESRVKLTLSGFTCNVISDFTWIAHIVQFFKAPPHVFESVIPSERTRISLKVLDGSVRMLAPVHSGALLLYLGELDLSTDIVGDSQENFFRLHIISAYTLFLDEPAVNITQAEATETSHPADGLAHWKGSGYALLLEISDMSMIYKANAAVDTPFTNVSISRVSLLFHLCADTMSTVTAFLDDFGSVFKKSDNKQLPKVKRQPVTITEALLSQRGVISSVDEHAFKQIPEVGPAPDMIYDDLPTNLDYLDESFGAAAGLRELRDDDLDDFDVEDMEFGGVTSTSNAPQTGIISKIGGETIKILQQEGIRTIENYFDNLPPDPNSGGKEYGKTTLSIRVCNCDVVLFLYDGYDWAKTRKTIETEVKDMRRRLAKIRQLVAAGQIQDPSIEETGTLLFNSVYVGLQQNVDELETGALIAAIDEELDDEFETASQSSWQSLRPTTTERTPPRSFRVHGKRLTRSRGPCMEFRFSGVDVEFDEYLPSETLLSRTLVTVKDVEILDHIKTSTWQKFLTELRVDSRGNTRETDSNMVRMELRSVRPVPGHPSEEARLRMKILPLRLYVDQDALDFMKRFFSFEDPHAPPSKANTSDSDIYFQFAEIFPVDLKLDYKPRRVDYRALKEGRSIELMNFFHFDGAEMTLRHITLSGITGWSKLFELLNDLWTPDVKATQLMDVISGVSPIRSVVNVGSGVADLVLLPIAQYKKDGRIVRGMQKGTTAFVKSTAMEALKLGARLATGTQVILEQAEGVLGSQFRQPVTAETLQVPAIPSDSIDHPDDDDIRDKISKFAEQPMDIREGVQTAYRSLRKNFSSAAQTILAVPMEVYERSGNEGPVRAVIRAVPIAVLKPMIGVTEAVSKTLLGIQNSLDPNMRYETEAKYKHR